MPRIKKNLEYPLTFNCTYGNKAYAGDRCKFISYSRIWDIVAVELEKDNGYGKRVECYPSRLKGIERFICQE